MSKKLLRKKLALMLANLKKKRKYYVECEYLESTGTQYINTGVLPANEMEFECKFTFTSLVSTNLTIIGSRDGEKRCQPIGAYNNKWSASIGGSYDANGTSVSANTPYIIKSTITNGQTITTNVNGSQASTCTSTTGLPSQELYIFARNFYGNTDPADSKVNGKLNFLKIKANGVLVRDLIPVLDWNMTPCMYDRVTEQLFYNQGTGDFVAGRQIHPVEYLESTGTQYIDTGFKPSDTAGYYAKFAYSETTDETTVALGARTSGQNNRWWLNISTDFEGIVFGFGSYLSTQREAPQNTVLEASCNLYNDRKYKYITKNWQENISTTCPDVPFNAYLYAANVSGVLTLPVQNLKLYSVKFTDGSSLVRDFIPAISEDGTPFMFDRVSHTCFLNQGTGQFKYPAREVEYIESTGTQYINTGYNPNSNTKVEAKFKMNETANTFRWLFSSRNQALAGDGYGFGAVANGFIDSEYNSRVSSTTDKLTNGTVYTIVKDKNVCRYNDSVLTNPESTFTVNYPLPIFALNNIGTIEVSSYTKANCYYFKIYDNDILVRDFIPVFQDGVACMVDKLTGTSYLNQGTGTFTTGKIVEPEYE